MQMLFFIGEPRQEVTLVLKPQSQVIPVEKASIEGPHVKWSLKDKSEHRLKEKCFLIMKYTGEKKGCGRTVCEG